MKRIYLRIILLYIIQLSFCNFIKVKNTALASKHIKEVVRIFDPSGNQNDAHEFLIFLLDKANEEASTINLDSLKSEKLEINKKGGNDNKITIDNEGEWEEVKKRWKKDEAY